MRLLYINSVLVDIDEKTAIGIDLQTYDIKEPARPKVTVSNSFSIPRTNKNLKAVGFLGGVQNTLTTIYDVGSCNYFINNLQYIKDAKVKIQSISDRIEIVIFQKNNIWDDLKKTKWADFEASYFAWLTCPKVGSEYTGTFNDFIGLYITDGGSSELFLPIVNTDNSSLYYMVLSSNPSSGYFESGGCFHSFFISLFKYLEDTYSLDFYTGTTFDGNIWDDAIGAAMYWNFRNIYPAQNGTGLFFGLITDQNPVLYLGTDLVAETKDKTLYDLVTAFIQKLNIMVIPTDAGFKMVRFDDLELYGGITEFSGMVEGLPKYKPYVDGFAQESLISFATVESGLNPLINSKTITCQNKNIEVKNELFKINAFIPKFTTRGGLFSIAVPDISTTDSFKNFKIFVNNAADAGTVTVLISLLGGTSIISTKTTMKAAALYDINSEYTLLNTAMQYPVYYELKKWMNATTIFNLDFFKLYYFKELGGAFFINKIKGFNPELSKQATTLELFKISNKAPDVNVITYDYFTDGLDNIFEDGNNNEFL